MTAGHAVFRADASGVIGTGHVIRCRTLAAALVARGWTASLATRDLPGPLARKLVDAGLGVVPLEGVVATPTAEADAIDSGEDGSITLLVADHYGIDAQWFESMRDRASVLMAIDDMADRRLPVDLVLNQNLGAETARYQTLVPGGARVLVGPRYALVRPEFAERRARRRVRDGRVARILVFISGSDADDVTSRAVEALTGIDVAVDVVVGAAYPHLAALRRRVAGHAEIQLHVNVDTMAELMDRADLAIGAPGSASWERCALGLPAVLVTLADNQSLVAQGLVEVGAAVAAGWHTAVTPDAIRDIVMSLIADPARVAQMSRAAAAVTDGRGSDRVVAAIEELIAARMDAQ